MEGAEGGRGLRLGCPVGPRSARLAHRVLGDGRAAARRRLRDPRRRQRPRLPHQRTRPRRRAWAAAPSSPRSGCTTACCSCAAARWARASATRSACTRWSARWARRAAMLFAGNHYRQPMAFDEERLAEPAPASRASATPRGGWQAASRPPTCAGTATRSSPRWPRTSTARRRSARCSSGSARPTAAASPSAVTISSRC